jgi:hypothetical protein
VAHVADAVIDAYKSLRSGGVYVMQDITASSRVEKNLDHALAPFIYTILTMHCMSVSLASGGMDLDAAWGRELAKKMLRTAGFSDVSIHRLEQDILNDYYVCRKH